MSRDTHVEDNPIVAQAYALERLAEAAESIAVSLAMGMEPTVNERGDTLAEAIDRGQRCEFCGRAAYVVHAPDCTDPAFLAPPEDSLDAAWAEAEAALPEGWVLFNLAYGDGTWSTLAAPRDGFDWEGKEAIGPTPAAALRALTAKLRGRA